MSKTLKIIIPIVCIIAAVTIMLLLIPVENKRLLHEKYGILADNAETDTKAKYILEHYDEYPEEIISLYYFDCEYYRDFVYDYFEHKDDYSKMSFTEEELNSDEVPLLLMKDYRWAYESFDGGIIYKDGCVAVSLSMAYLKLRHNGDMDPVKIARAASDVGAIQIFDGIIFQRVQALCEYIGLNVVEYNYRPGDENSEEFALDVIKQAIDEDKVVLAGMVGETFGGHGLIIRGYDDNGMLYINDPASEEKSEKAWDFNRIQPEIYFLWVLS